MKLKKTDGLTEAQIKSEIESRDREDNSCEIAIENSLYPVYLQIFRVLITVALASNMAIFRVFRGVLTSSLIIYTPEVRAQLRVEALWQFLRH